MTKFTGKLTFKNLQQFALENGLEAKKGSKDGYVIVDYDDKVDAYYRTLKEAFRYVSNHIEEKNLDNLKTESIPLSVSAKDDKQLLEVNEHDNLIDGLKTAKSVISFRKTDKDTHKLLIAVNNGQFMAVGSNGLEYAIATCPLEINQEFITVVPIEKTHGFCKVLEVLKKQKKLKSLSYRLEDERLVAECDGSKFSFNVLPVYSFDISDELQVIIDEFMASDRQSEVINESKTEDIQEYPGQNATGELCTLATPIACLLPEVNQQQTENSEVKEVITEVKEDSKTTQYVMGVGDIELISIEQLKIGMYLFFNSFIYTVNNIEKVDFINNRASYIVTVTSLLNAVDTQKILLSGSEQLAAWQTSFESKNGIAKDAIQTSDRSEKSEVNKVAKREVKPVIQDIPLSSDIPKPTMPVKNNTGIKGEGREKLLKMVAHGCSLQDMMTAFDWSKKNAQNHITYIKWWGYDLRRVNDDIYKLA